MRLPRMIYQSKMYKQEQFAFGGIERRKGASDGSVCELINVSSDSMPLYTNSKGRIQIKKVDKPWLYVWDGHEVIVSGKTVNAAYNVPYWEAKYYNENEVVAYGGDFYICTGTIGSESYNKNPSVNTVSWERYYFNDDKNVPQFYYDGVYDTNTKEVIKYGVYHFTWDEGYGFFRNLTGEKGDAPNEDTVNWEPYSYASLFIDGKEVEHLELIPDSGKEAVILNGVVLIIPDNAYYNTNTEEKGFLSGTKKKSFSTKDIQGFYYNGKFWNKKLVADICDSNDYIDGMTGTLDTIRFSFENTDNMSGYSSFNLKDYFSDGDVVTVSQDHRSSRYTEIVTGQYIIEKVTSDALVFTPSAFAGSDFGQDFSDNNKELWRADNLEVSVGAIELKHICISKNRVWGVNGDDIYASELGNCLKWQNYTGISTDPWTTHTGSNGDFTACCEYGGQPLFFKEGAVYTVNGDYYSTFGAQRIADIGIRSDSHKSFAKVNSVLYWLSEQGVCAFTGGIPSIMSAPLDVTLSEGMASTDGVKYYLCCNDGKGRRLYIYDSRYGVWTTEDMKIKPLGFARNFDSVNIMDDEGNITAVAWNEDIDGAYELHGMSVIEFNPFYEGTTDKKDIGKIIIRASVAPELGGMDIKIMYDSDGKWEKVGRIYNQSDRVKVSEFGFYPRRCDSRISWQSDQ